MNVMMITEAVTICVPIHLAVISARVVQDTLYNMMAKLVWILTNVRKI